MVWNDATGVIRTRAAVRRVIVVPGQVEAARCGDLRVVDLNLVGLCTRDWRIYADFAQPLIGIARRLYVNEPFSADLSNTAYALDSTTIDLSLSLFSWAPF